MTAPAFHIDHIAMEHLIRAIRVVGDDLVFEDLSGIGPKTLEQLFQASGMLGRSETFVISASDVSNGYVTLSLPPANVKAIQVNPVGGVLQLNQATIIGPGLVGDYVIADFASNPERLYFRNVSPAASLSEHIAEGDVINVEYLA
jgi:hypothetical protein